MTSSMQQWNPEQYAENARFVPELGMPVLDLLAPQPGERILDLGCGDGALTMKLAQFGCRVLGVDSSPAMLEAARALKIDVQLMSGEALAFDEVFDAVFSNAALHWMKDQQRVIAGVWRALRPGGRFVAELGGHGNVASIVDALDAAIAARGMSVDCPWYFPRPDEYAALLEAAGFRVESMLLLSRPTPLPGNVGDWLGTFAQSYIKALPEAGRRDFVESVVADLRPMLMDAQGNWTADYVRLRFGALKP